MSRRPRGRRAAGPPRRADALVANNAGYRIAHPTDPAYPCRITFGAGATRVFIWGSRATVIVALTIATGAAAQPTSENEAVSGPVQTNCELHVWPGSGLGSAYHGWFHGGIANGAVTGREGYPQVPAEPLATAEQKGMLDTIQPQALIGLADYRLVLHDEALPSRQIRTATTRILADGAPCYAELIVDDVFFQQDWVNGSALKILFRFRQFGDGAAPTRTFGSWVQTPITRLPLKDASELPAAVEELRNAYRANVRKFGVLLQKPPKKRG